MRKKSSYYKQVLKLLEELYKDYPTLSIGQHLSTALDGYGDLWGVSDKEFVFALEKYIATFEMGTPLTTEEELDRIVEEGKHLDRMFEEEEDEEDKYDDSIENY